MVAVTGSSVMVGCGGYNRAGCSFGTYGSYAAVGGTAGSFGGSFGGTMMARARTHLAAAPPRQHIAQGTRPAEANVCSDPNPNPAAGIFEGTLSDKASQQQTPVVAIIAEDGEGRVSAQDGTFYRLNVFNSGYNSSGSFEAFSQGLLFANGQPTSSGSFNAAPSSAGLNATLQYKSGDTATLALSFDQASDMASSLSVLQGSWTYAATALTLNITVQTDGSWSGTDSANCSYSGSFSLIDANENAYAVHYKQTCNGTDKSFSGLASYFPAQGSSPVQLRVFADDGAGDFLAGDFQVS